MPESELLSAKQRVKRLGYFFLVRAIVSYLMVVFWMKCHRLYGGFHLCFILNRLWRSGYVRLSIKVWTCVAANRSVLLCYTKSWPFRTEHCPSSSPGICISSLEYQEKTFFRIKKTRLVVIGHGDQSMRRTLGLDWLLRFGSVLLMLAGRLLRYALFFETVNGPKIDQSGQFVVWREHIMYAFISFIKK